MNYKKPDRPYLDVHNHFGRTINRAPTVGQNVAMCLARFSQTGIHAALGMSTATGSPILHGAADIRAHNETTARAMRDHPDRFPVGLALAEVRFGEQGLVELDRAISELGLHGFVDHPPFNESSLPFIEVAAAHNGLVNLHCHTELMRKIASMFPTATFIVHASTWAADNMASCENCIFEIVQYPDGRGSVWDFEKLASKVGSDRIVFGADLPYYDYRQLQQQIESAPIAEELKDKIAWKNAETLFRRFNPVWTMPSSPPVAPRIYPDEWLWAAHPEKTDRLIVDVVRGPASTVVLK
jgi:predicted TIM-barrel fold metal-dependent hydrolase